MATHCSILAWRIQWTEEPGRIQSTGSQESDTTEREHRQQSVWCKSVHKNKLMSGNYIVKGTQTNLHTSLQKSVSCFLKKLEMWRKIKSSDFLLSPLQSASTLLQVVKSKKCLKQTAEELYGMWNVLRSQYDYPLSQCTYSTFLKNNQWTSSSSQAHFGHQESAGWPASHSIKSPSACRRCLLAICFRFSIYAIAW